MDFLNIINLFSPHTQSLGSTLVDLEQNINLCIDEIIVIGDFNLNLLNRTYLRDFYLDMVKSYGFSFVSTTAPP